MLGISLVDSIIKNREFDGRFKSLEEFCCRIDYKDFNRRSIESLIKACTFDSVIENRARAVDSLEQILEVLPYVYSSFLPQGHLLII